MADFSEKLKHKLKNKNYVVFETNGRRFDFATFDGVYDTYEEMMLDYKSEPLYQIMSDKEFDKFIFDFDKNGVMGAWATPALSL